MTTVKLNSGPAPARPQNSGWRVAGLALLFLLTAANGSAKTYYEAYEEGLAAAKKRSWSVVVEKMSEAIRGKSSENARERTYGNIFIKYHPYYYRGIAYFNLGDFNKARNDLQRTSGVGSVDLGSADSFIEKADAKIAAANTPVTQTVATNTVATQTIAPPPPPPVDTIGPARQQAEETLRAADQTLRDATQVKAETYAASEFNQARQLLVEARNQAANADSLADWTRVTQVADRSQRMFTAAAEKARMQAAAVTTTPGQVTEDLLANTKRTLRRALDLYYKGDFRNSAAEFGKLTRGDQQGNAMIWAFLGASQYYNYYLDGESNSAYRTAAETAFRRARKLRPSLELSTKYFSPRIRKFYASLQ